MMKSVFRSSKTPPETPEDRALAKRFEQKVRLSLLALLFERIWEALLWPFFVVATFLVVTLLDLWSITPPLAHRVLLGAFGLALAVSFLPLIRIALPGTTSLENVPSDTTWSLHAATEGRCSPAKRNDQ